MRSKFAKSALVLVPLDQCTIVIMSSASSAAEMIRRFREGPPISREDRAAAVADGNAPHNMWWSTANKRGGEDNDISLRKDSHSHINVKSDPLEHSEGSEPRIGSTLQRPEPAASRSISPMSRIAKYEGKLHHKSFRYCLTLKVVHSDRTRRILNYSPPVHCNSNN